MKEPSWFRVIAPHFVGGGNIHKGKVTKCANIIKYMTGWPLQYMRDYCAEKRWTLEEYHE